MLKFLEKFGRALEPVAEKLAGNRVLSAIKDGFIAIMPLLIIGSFAVVLNSVILDWGKDSLWYNLGIKISTDTADAIAEYKAIGGFVWQGTLAIIGLLVSFTIAYSYSKHSKQDGLSAGVLGIASFMAVQIWGAEVAVENGDPLTAWAVNPANLGSANILTAMLVALIAGAVYVFCVKRNLTIKMPEGVPPGVSRAFEALIPGTILLFGFAVLAFVFQKFDTELSLIISDAIGKPLQKFGAEGPVIAYIYVTLSNVLFFFGIHGPNVLSFLEATVLTPASVENTNMIASGGASNLIFSKGMLDSFVFLGGSGTTLGLIISIFLVGKKKADRAVSKFAFTPGLFNINEPLVFGLPIVMNPVLFIPYVLSPAILLTTAWLQIVFYNSIGLLENTGGVLIPWISPIGIGAFLAYQSFFAVVIAFTQLAIAVLIYMPFVFVANYIKDGTEEVQEKVTKEVKEVA